MVWLSALGTGESAQPAWGQVQVAMTRPVREWMGEGQEGSRTAGRVSLRFGECQMEESPSLSHVDLSIEITEAPKPPPWMVAARFPRHATSFTLSRNKGRNVLYLGSLCPPTLTEPIHCHKLLKRATHRWLPKPRSVPSSASPDLLRRLSSSDDSTDYHSRPQLLNLPLQALCRKSCSHLEPMPLPWCAWILSQWYVTSVILRPLELQKRSLRSRMLSSSTSYV